MASSPDQLICSDCQFNPDELSEIMSAMAQENSCVRLSSGRVSNGAISPGETLDDDVQMSFCNKIDEVDHVFSLSQQSPILAGGLEATNPTWMLDHKMGLRGVGAMGGTKIVDHNLDGESQLLADFEFGGDSAACGFKSSFIVPLSSASPGETWGLGVCGMPAIEQINVKVRRYTEEERKDRILRYLQKRNQRNFNKTIKYACRKKLADRRVRVRGRFARNNELRLEESCASVRN